MKGSSRAQAAAIAMTRRIQRSIDLGATLITARERSGSGPGPERSSAGTECAHAGRSISWSASSMSARSGLHSACSALKTVRRARLDASGDISLSRLGFRGTADEGVLDRKSTRLNCSHLVISYAVFCLKKKKQKKT